MTALQQAARWLFLLCLPVLLVTASIWWAANSHWLYMSGFARYDVGQTTGLEQPELEKAAAGLIDYFNSPAEYVGITVVKNGHVARALGLGDSRDAEKHETNQKCHHAVGGPLSGEPSEQSPSHVKCSFCRHRIA